MSRLKFLKRLGRFGLAVTAAAAVFAGFAQDARASNVADAIAASLADKQPAFISFAGTVVEIRDYTGDDTRKFVSIEDGDEGVVNFVASPDTYYANGLTLEEGMSLTGYYDAYKPMLMIYPPQPDAAAFWAGADDDATFAKVDRFDEDMVSYDGILKLNIGEDTSVTDRDGQPLPSDAAELAGKALMVFYDVTTRSIPAQTTPSLIVVLGDAATAPQPVDDVPVVAETVLPEAGTALELVVEGSVVGGINLVLAEDNVIMVPLYMVCQGLDVTLEWLPEANAALVAGTYTVPFGEDSYVTDGVSIALGAPSMLIDDRTYVPLSFFTQVMGLNNAYYSEGQIVIDNNEKME